MKPIIFEQKPHFCRYFRLFYVKIFLIWISLNKNNKEVT